MYIFLITFVVKIKMKKNRFPTLGGNIYNTRNSPPVLCEISPAGPEQPAFRAYLQIL